MKTLRSSMLPVLVALVSLAAAAWLNRYCLGQWDERSMDRIEAMARRFDDIDLRFGQWQGERMDDTRTDLVKEESGGVGYFTASFRSTARDDVVRVMLSCGKSRKIAIHTPDACYAGGGTEMLGEIEKVTVELPPAEGESEPRLATFNTAIFEREDADSQTVRFRSYWAWSTDGTWEAPNWPRMKYGGRTPLAKLYIDIPCDDVTPPEESPNQRFAQEFLPVLRRTVFDRLDDTEAASRALAQATADNQR